VEHNAATDGCLEIILADSLPYVLASTLSILAMAPFYEGFDPWIDVTYAALSAELRDDVHRLFFPFAAALIFAGLLEEPPAVDDFPSFVAWLTSLSDEGIREVVEARLPVLASDEEEEAVPPLDDTEAMTLHLKRLCGGWRDEDTRLLQDAASFRSQITLSVVRFWESHFREEYAKCAPIVAECAARSRAEKPAGGFAEVVSGVTGRTIPESTVRKHDAARRLVFVPSCYTGPYVNYIPVDPAGRDLVVIFNARLSERGERSERLPIREMFAPLRALSDETRLEILRMLKGEELYAQQIVERLSISQPSVSRHLRLMVASGVLTERRDEKMKYYRINEEMLATLAWSFSAFLSSGDETDRRRD